MSNDLVIGRHLCKAFGGRSVVDKVDFRIERGDFILLCGENGSGKTTLLNILTGHLEADAGEVVYSSVSRDFCRVFPQPNMDRLNPFGKFTPESLARLGFRRTWQDIRLFQSLTVRENVEISASNDIGPLTSSDVLRSVGLLEFASRPASELSLGQAKRLSIARAIAGEARVLFLDEPLSGLDRVGIETIVRVLIELNRSHKVALVIVEHALNYSYFASLANKIWLLEGGGILASNATRSLLEGATVEKRLALIGGISDKDTVVVEEPLAGGAHLTRVRSRDISSRIMLDVRNVHVIAGALSTVSVADGRATDTFDIKLYEGEVAFLWAPNGWGKTTLCRGISGLLPIDKGTIFLNGVKIDGLVPWERAKKGLHTLPADYGGFPNLLVSEAMVVAGGEFGNEELTSIVSRRCGTLSGGQMQRLAFSSSIAETGVLLFDEPFARMDISSVKDALQRLKPSLGRAALVFMPST